MYRDKHGEEIKAGMFLRHIGGSVELVYEGTTHDGKPSLGLSAGLAEIYPLHQFDLSEWEICNEE